MSRYRQTMAEAMEKVHLSEKEISKLRNGVKVLGNALPNRALAQKMADKANREMGHDADVYQSPFNNRFYVRIKEETLNEKDHEVSMARGELEAISDKALKLSSILQGKSDEGNPLEAWVQSKITKAKDYINSVADYMEYNPDNANEEFELEENFSDAQIAQLKKAYGPLKDKRISIDNANKMRAMFDKLDKNKDNLEKLYKADIPFISSMASARLISKHNYKAQQLIGLRKEGVDIAVGELKEINELYKQYTDEELGEMFGNKQIDPTTAAALRAYLSGRAGGSPFPPVIEGMMSKIDQMQKDGKSVADIAKELKMDVKVVKGILGEEVKDKDSAYAIGMAQAKKMKGDEPPLKKSTITKGHEIAKSILKKEDKEHPAKAIYESISAVRKKSDETGMPYSVLKQVYDRGMAAWRGGHRPGATQVQWALARVNSFVTKSSGTWGGADKDLAAKVKGSK